MLKNRAARKMFVSKREEVRRGGIILHRLCSTLIKIQGEQIKVDKLGRACSTYRGEENEWFW